MICARVQAPTAPMRIREYSLLTVASTRPTSLLSKVNGSMELAPPVPQVGSVRPGRKSYRRIGAVTYGLAAEVVGDGPIGAPESGIPA
ncbi:hypothetical protein GCM10023215_25030 [Pseudonocardia yuanmonensis]|uniref:Uncharacterized protein n=1 Tax=Pseudonocardia yuanmonensis TaxID=1095914 RepID=A0ABP8WGY8_9PSEU